MMWLLVKEVVAKNHGAGEREASLLHTASSNFSLKPDRGKKKPTETCFSTVLGERW